jgi:hypothetical protein
MKRIMTFTVPYMERTGQKPVLDKIIELLLYLTCLFPFTMWIPAIYTGSDTQPYAFLVSLAVVMYYFCLDKNKAQNMRAERIIVLLFWLCVLMGILALVAIPDYGFSAVARKYMTYVSIIAIPYATCLVWKRNGGMNEPLIKVCVLLWFFSGLIQKTINSSFGSGFVVRQTTDSMRGLVGLATEPSAYGFYCFFVLLLVLSFRKNRWLYILLLLIQIFLFAQSSVTLVYFGVYVIGFALNEIVLHKRFALLRSVVLVGAGIGALYYLYTKSLLPTRMNRIMGYVVNANWDELLKDGSIEQRINGITQSFSVLIANRGLPNGFGGDRYFSGVGILIAEGGFISILLLCVIGKIIYDAYPRKYRFIFVFGFMVTMLSSIPFSSPIVCFYLGYCLYMGSESKKKVTGDCDERI